MKWYVLKHLPLSGWPLALIRSASKLETEQFKTLRVTVKLYLKT